jgi:predicted nucleotidyltransferase
MIWQRMHTDNAVEGFAVETLDGLIFTVKGLVHPPDRLIAYLRYVPDSRGDRKRGEAPYRRVYRFEEQREILKSRFPTYINYDPVFGLQLQGVPWQYIRKVYDPCHRLANIRKRGAADPLEENALAFAELLQDTSGVPMERLGVSGSLLVNLHRPESDLDVIVYGEQEAWAVHGALRQLLNRPSGPIRGPDTETLLALHASHRTDTPLSFSDFARLQSRKVNEGYFAGIQYFIRFVKRTEQCQERYGNPRFEPLGRATIRFRVKDDRDAIFTPCRYVTEDVVFLDRRPAVDLREVIAFRGRFSDQARIGEAAVARGSLERVIARAGRVHHCLTVGGEAGDFLLSQASAMLP